MPQLTQIPFAISSSSAYSQKNNNSLLLNLYPQIEEEGSKSSYILINTCGVELITELPKKIIGIYEFLDVVYIATIDKLYSFSNGVYTEIGDMDFSTRTKAIFSDNGTNLVIVAGNGYYYTPSTDTFGSMEQEGWYEADTVAYLDGYFVFNRSGTGQFFISKLFSVEIDPIDWATAEAAPDDTVGVAIASRQLWLIGQKTTEIWYDSGDADFPFTRISGAVNDIGCVEYKTIATIKSSITFVGEDFKVYASNGYALEPISTPTIEKELSRANVLTMSAFSYTEEGHWFYCLTLNDSNTFVYDFNTGKWHNRESADRGRWLIDGAFNLLNNGKPFGYGDTKLYSMSIDNLTEDGTPIKREAITLPVNKTVNRIRIHEAQLDMEVGFTENNALVRLQMSQDGGKTWGHFNEAHTGDTGEFRSRIKWDRLGQVRDCIFKITIFEDVPIRLIGFHIRAS